MSRKQSLNEILMSGTAAIALAGLVTSGFVQSQKGIPSWMVPSFMRYSKPTISYSPKPVEKGLVKNSAEKAEETERAFVEDYALDLYLGRLKSAVNKLELTRDDININETDGIYVHIHRDDNGTIDMAISPEGEVWIGYHRVTPEGIAGEGLATFDLDISSHGIKGVHSFSADGITRDINTNEILRSWGSNRDIQGPSFSATYQGADLVVVEIKKGIQKDDAWRGMLKEGEIFEFDEGEKERIKRLPEVSYFESWNEGNTIPQGHDEGFRKVVDEIKERVELKWSK
jgi:hypothetical protein